MMKKEIYALAPKGTRVPLRGLPLQEQLAIHHLYKPLRMAHPFDFFSINPPSTEILDNNAFGYLLKGEAGVLGMTFVGGRVIFGDRPSQEDALDFDYLQIPAWDASGSASKQGVLKKTLLDLGEALIETDEEGDCIAGLSGSTLVTSVSDSEGITWASVGDSYLLLCVVKPDGKVHLSVINPIHSVNSAELLRIKSHHPDILKTMMKQNKPKSITRPRICGLEMSRAFGDESVSSEAGIEFTPDVGTIFYDEIKDYDAAQDTLFIIHTSDGLFHTALLSVDEQAEIENQPLPAWTEPPLWKESNLDDSQKEFCKNLDVFEARGKIREALFLRIYEKSIENVLKTEPKAVEEGILSALSGEAAQRSQNHISNAPDNISCVLVPVGPMMNTPVLALVADGHTGPEAAVYLKENLVNMLDFTLVSEANATSEASTPINKF